MKQINQNEFDNEIKEGITVVDFFATWCGPCKMLSPLLEQLSNEMPEVNFVKVDVDDNGELAQRFGIMSIPSVFLFKDGQEVSHFVGYQPAEAVKDFINRAK